MENPILSVHISVQQTLYDIIFWMHRNVECYIFYIQENRHVVNFSMLQATVILPMANYHSPLKAIPVDKQPLFKVPALPVCWQYMYVNYAQKVMAVELPFSIADNFYSVNFGSFFWLFLFGNRALVIKIQENGSYWLQGDPKRAYFGFLSL